MYHLWSFMSRCDHCHQYHPERTSGASGFDSSWNTHIAVFTYEWPTRAQQFITNTEEYKTWNTTWRQQEFCLFWKNTSEHLTCDNLFEHKFGWRYPAKKKQDDISFVSLNQQLLLFNKIIIKHLRVDQNYYTHETTYTRLTNRFSWKNRDTEKMLFTRLTIIMFNRVPTKLP